MTNQEILVKAIEKAVKNGWLHIGMSIATGIGGIPDLKWNEKDWDKYITEESYYSHIFSHDFAKAFWGEKEHDAFTDFDGGEYDCSNCKMIFGQGDNYCWEVHLQQMVVKKDPTKYLEQFI